MTFTYWENVVSTNTGTDLPRVRKGKEASFTTSRFRSSCIKEVHITLTVSKRGFERTGTRKRHFNSTLNNKPQSGKAPERTQNPKLLTSAEALDDLGRGLHLLERDGPVGRGLEAQHSAQIDLLVELVRHLGELGVDGAAVGAARLLQLRDRGGVVQVDLAVLAVVEVAWKGGKWRPV